MVILAISAALMFVLQVAMSPLPNIEPVSLLIIVVTCFYGWDTLLSVAVFILLEGCVYGFGLWWFFYLYAWPVLVVLTVLLKPVLKDSALGYAILSGFFGLAFGFLYALILLVNGGGWQSVIAAWISGIPFDLLHCAGNFVLCLVLFKPLSKLLERFASGPVMQGS